MPLNHRLVQRASQGSLRPVRSSAPAPVAAPAEGPARLGLAEFYDKFAHVFKQHVPLGHCIAWSADSLMAMSQVTPADIDAAAQYWLNHAPYGFTYLLDASAGDSDGLGFDWDPAAGCYVDAHGRVVAWQWVRAALEQVIERGGEACDKLTAQLQGGDISLAAWQLGMSAEMKLLLIVAAIAAMGGWAQRTDAGMVELSRELRRQFVFLLKFASNIDLGREPLSGGRLRARVQLYAQAARGTFEQARRQVAKAMGKTLERRFLGAADHCAGCVGQATMGWQPVGTLDRIGDEECLTNCQCSFEFR